MSKLDFSTQDFEFRRKRVREAMASAGLDWLVVIHPVSIHWLTGSDAKSYQEFQCLLISAEPGDIIVLTREGERSEFLDDALVDQIWTFGMPEPEDPILLFEKVANSLGLKQARVGMEVPAYYLHPHHYVRMKQFLGEALVAEPTNLIHDLKLVKSETELKYIREASRIADIAMDAFVKALREGVTELQLAGTVYQALFQNHSGMAASPINLVSGPRAGFSHGAPTDRVLRRGETGSIEYGAMFKRYTSTIGRQFCLGTPSPRAQELYDVVRRASDACIAEIRHGVPAVVPHLAAKRVIDDAGLGRGRVHTTGYGLAPGFPPTWGEPLHMLGDSTYTLQAGMVITVEPPVFIGDEFLGARIIDNVLVTQNGAELLSRFSRDLIVID
ncbi:M24 family metallopeptidase [Schlesneria sp. DSM 10557]|uniref:M24 family metallopeptidase n=1 Tax=Schlesneria sp. DSM 10557 TaxID=3044399 RepID=UPI0035A1C6B9